MNGKLTVGSLFSGIGGLELGLERTGYFETRWQCEINEYARKVLAKNWPGLPIYQDVKELYESEFPERVDVLCGGFPCQPFSTAGKRRGESDERFLWPEFIRIVREVQPRWVIAENVPGLLTIDSGRVFGRILGDLASCGYDAEWDTISAASVGALHPRNRIFIVAHANDQRGREESLGLARSSHPSIFRDDGKARFLADTNCSDERVHPGAIPETPGDLRRGATGDLSPGCGQVLADAHFKGLEGRGAHWQSADQWLVRQGGSVPNASGEGRQCRQPGFGRFDPQCGEGIPGRCGSGAGQISNTEDARDHRRPGFGNDDRPHGRVGGNEQGGRDATLGQCHAKPDLGYGPLELGRRDNRHGMFRDAIWKWWAIEPDVGRVANGVPSRVDRLRCLGNAVVPQCAEYIGMCILEWEGLM